MFDRNQIRLNLIKFIQSCLHHSNGTIKINDLNLTRKIEKNLKISWRKVISDQFDENI